MEKGTKTKLLERLIEQDAFVSGAVLCQELQISRAAVWKHIQQLKEEGYTIESVRQKGYRLAATKVGLNAVQIEKDLKGRGIKNAVIFYETVDSTNAVAKQLVSKTMIPPFLVVADEQTAGKGRRGRDWWSEKGAGIYMTLLIRPDFDPVQASKLTLLTALAVEKAIKTITGHSCGIKWPNDLIIGNKKVCGILTEMATELNEIKYVMMGIGINVNQKCMVGGLETIGTSLYESFGKTYDRHDLIIEVITHFYELYELYACTGSFDALVAVYEQACMNVGKTVYAQTSEGAISGQCLGIDVTGGLKIQLEQGVTVIQSGEVSIKGIYN